MKRDSQFVWREVPRFSEIAHYLQVLVILDEAVVYVTGYVVRSAIGGQQGYQV